MHHFTFFFFTKDNAVAIFDLFRQSMPEYPLNALDADENTGELIGYVTYLHQGNSTRNYL